MDGNRYAIVVLGLIGALWSLFAQGEVLEIRHYQVQERYEFGIKVLDLALRKQNIEYKLIGPLDPDINEARGEAEVVAGRMDLQFLSTTAEREAKMIPIRIPLYRGMLGLRLLLVKKSRRSELSNIYAVGRLASLTGLHGSHWGDLPVYAANGLPVVTNASYEALFSMLIAGRADYFHRGISEIGDELAHHNNDLTIADGIALFYPHPVYFFVTKKRPELARQLEQGLRMALEDGSYRALFEQEYRSIIQQAGLDQRRIIVLKNPVIPKSTPPMNTSWWMPAVSEIPRTRLSAVGVSSEGHIHGNPSH